MEQNLDRRFLLGGLAGAAGVAALATLAKAGPLNPPSGPIGSTGKPIGEIEPRVAVNTTNTPGGFGAVFRLVSPGSYYLTGNITVPAGGTGVSMDAGTTLDLNGYTITGSDASSLGIRLNNACTVRNGTIANCGNALTVGVAPNAACLIEDLTVTGFSGRGIDVGGGSVVRRCTVNGQGITGVELQGDYGLVEGCAVSNNSGTAVYLNSYSVARGCFFNRCGIGLRLGTGSVADGCTAAGCNHSGITTLNRCAVHRCQVSNVTVGFAGNPGVGIDLGDGSEAVGCSAVGCYMGIRASTGGRLIDCSVDQCTTAAVRLTGADNTVEACRINRSTTGVDMSGTGGNYVHKCVLMGNGQAIGVTVGGNWYPNVALAGTNTATNPLASVVA